MKVFFLLCDAFAADAPIKIFPMTAREKSPVLSRAHSPYPGHFVCARQIAVPPIFYP
jgi:hypothetical protein